MLPLVVAMVNELAPPALPLVMLTEPAVSVTDVFPDELAVSVVALVEEIEAPPAPAETVSIGVVRVPVLETLPLLAVSDIAVAGL